MKRLIFQVYVGNQSNLYDWCTESVSAYCFKHNIEHKILLHPKLFVKPDIFNPAGNRSKESWGRLGYLPIFEKEVAFEYFDRFDQIAIIDSDIYIRPDAPNIFEQLGDADFAGVLERDLPCTPAHRQKLATYSRMQYNSRLDVDFHFDKHGAADFYNMGLMVMNKSITKYIGGLDPYSFIMQPRFKKFVDGEGPWKWSTDQTLLNYWVKKDKMKTKQLDWRWNALYTAIPNDKIKDAHFIHFYLKDKLPKRGEDVQQLAKDIGNAI